VRHRRAFRKFNRTFEHRLRMLQHLTEGLFKCYQIVTTVEKAKATRSHAEPLITLAKRGDSQAQRQVRRVIHDKVAYRTLFEKLGPLYAGRKGGYTRVIRLGRRPGDGAEQAVLELVDREQLGPPPGKFLKIKKEAKEKVGAGAP